MIRRIRVWPYRVLALDPMAALAFAAATPVLRAPTAAQAHECANNACSILAMDEDGDHETSAVVAEAVGHRIRLADAGHASFADWRDVDPVVARQHVGQRVTAWLWSRMSPAERETYEAARRMGADVDAAAELATRAEDLAADRRRESRRAAEACP